MNKGKSSQVDGELYYNQILPAPTRMHGNTQDPCDCYVLAKLPGDVVASFLSAYSQVKDVAQLWATARTTQRLCSPAVPQYGRLSSHLGHDILPGKANGGGSGGQVAAPLELQADWAPLQKPTHRKPQRKQRAHTRQNNQRATTSMQLLMQTTRPVW